MEIEVEVSADDHRALLRQRARLHPPSGPARRSSAARIALLLALVLLFTWAYTATSLKPAYILSAGIGFALALLAWGAAARATRGSEPPPLLGRQIVSLEGEGVRLRAERFELWLRWDAIDAVEESDEHLFALADPLPTIVVPKRCFASSEESAAFAARLRARG